MPGMTGTTEEFKKARKAVSGGISQRKLAPRLDSQTMRVDAARFAGRALDREAPTVDAASMDAAEIERRQQEQFRQQQLALAQALQQTAAGQGMSAAQQQLAAGQDANIRQARALAASQAGVSPGLAAQLAGRQAADANVQLQQQAGILRAQESAAAQQALGNLLAAGRGADIGLAQQQAGLQQQANLQNATLGQQAALANQQADLAQQQIANKAFMDAMGLQLGAQGQEFGQSLARAQYLTGLETDEARIAANLAGAQRSTAESPLDWTVGLGGLASSGAGALAAFLSDERAKENVQDADADVDELLGALKARSFDYKSEAGGEKGFLGFMAQDLEKSKAGRQMVTDVNGYKAVDARKALMAALASSARLSERLDQLEKKHG